MKKIKKTKKQKDNINNIQPIKKIPDIPFVPPKPSLMETLFGSLVNTLYLIILVSFGAILFGMFLYLLRVQLQTSLYSIFIGVFLIIGVAFLGRKILEEELPPTFPLNKIFLEILSFLLTSIWIIVLIFELFLIIAPQRGIGENIIMVTVVIGLILLTFTIYAYTLGKKRLESKVSRVWLIPLIFFNVIIMANSLLIESGRAFIGFERVPIPREQWVYFFAFLYLINVPYIMWYVRIPSPYAILNEPIEKIIEVDRGSSYKMVYFSVGIFLILLIIILLLLQTQEEWHELGLSSFSVSSLLFLFIFIPNLILYYALYKKYKKAGIIDDIIAMR